jgi:hypothetical protein
MHVLPKAVGGRFLTGGTRLPVFTVLGVLIVYGWIVFAHVWEPAVNAADRQPYNLLSQGFLAGRLHLLEPVPKGLMALADPYDPEANASYREPRIDGSSLHDLSYFRGNLHMYFGITPILVLFGPWRLLTGGHFPQEFAVLVFCCLGFIASAWLFCQLARTFFPASSDITVAAGLLALGLAGGLPLLMLRPYVYEVAISSAHAFVMLTLAIIWTALGRQQRPAGWLAAASLCYGLAIAARPSVLFGSIVLFVPVLADWCRTPRGGKRNSLLVLLGVAVIPITAVGLGIMWFNVARFGNPFEFGQRYMLAGINVHHNPEFFGARFIPYNLWVYFAQPVVWSAQSYFPVGIKASGTVPIGYFGVENPHGVLTSVPFVWLASAVGFRWRERAPDQRRLFKWIVIGILILFLTATVVISAFAGACGRYEADFLPPLMLLAALGLLAFERMFTSQPWRCLARVTWTILLLYSITVGVLVGASATSPYLQARICRCETETHGQCWTEATVQERCNGSNWPPSDIRT